jgi:Cytochrome c7 and related cytochrome c
MASSQSGYIFNTVSYVLIVTSRLRVSEVCRSRGIPVATASPAVIVTGDVPPVRTGGHRRLALFYIALSLVALVPGLGLKAGIELPGHFFALKSTLLDIQFGSGLRFWLGVTGATMMGLLLLYPLRKVMSKSRVLGSIGGWFQLHILLGLIGPVLILYHCNFGHGSANANVALWSMLLVALSGIAGTFAYGRASRDFYSTRHQALQHRDAIAAALSALEEDFSEKRELVAAFETFEAGLLTPRQGLVSCLVARLRVERSRQVIAHIVASIIEARAHRHSMSREDVRRIARPIAKHMKRYMVVARAAASQSIREQIWARWRMFHIPVFLIMIVAASLHVIAVWDMEALRASSLGVQQRAEADRQTSLATAIDEKHDAIESILAQDSTQPPAPRPPALMAPPQLVVGRPKPSSGVTTKSVSTVTVPAREDRAAPSENKSSVLAEAKLPIPKPAVRPAAVAPTPTPAVPQPEIESVYTELQKRDASVQMALGGAKPRTLADQIVTLKALRESKQFSHSETETGFPLTGKHLKVECTSCHTAPLRETAQPERRACIDCHKKDDVHSGRRPDCAQCHTTNRWTQIVRRR